MILYFLVLLARGGHCGYSRIFDSRSSLSPRTSTAQALGAQCNCRITISRSETRAQTPIPERWAQRQIRSLPSTFLAACLCEEREPGYAPGGAVTFFRVAERKSPKKGRPRCPCPLRFAPGQPAVLASGGVRANSLHCVALKQRAALIRLKLRSSARTEGIGSRTALRAFAALGPAPAVRAAQALGSDHDFRAAKLVL